MMDLDARREIDAFARFLGSKYGELQEPSKGGRGHANQLLSIQKAALDLLLEYRVSPAVIALFSDLMGGTLSKVGEADRAAARRLAGARFEAEHFAQIYEKEGLDPNVEQQLEPPKKKHVSDAMARACNNPGGDYRKDVERLRNNPAYQETVRSILLELVRPSGQKPQVTPTD